MITNDELNAAITDLKPILAAIASFQQKYSHLLEEIDRQPSDGALSTEQRNEEAIRLLKKYAEI